MVTKKTICLNKLFEYGMTGYKPISIPLEQNVKLSADEGVATSLWANCEGEAHTPKNGKLESSGILENSELDCKGQISLHLSDLGVVGKVLKCRCPKWPRMSHLDICSPSYGRKKGRESNCQFDSRPLKSQESTCSRRALQECNISLESSFQGL